MSQGQIQAGRETAHSFLRFTAWGAIGTGVQYVTLTVLVELFTADPAVASSLGFLLGAITNYYLNYQFTFYSTQPHAVALPKFLAIAGVGFLLNGSMVVLLSRVVPLYYLVAQLIATGLVTVWNYTANRSWTFRKDLRGVSEYGRES